MSTDPRWKLRRQLQNALQFFSPRDPFSFANAMLQDDIHRIAAGLKDANEYRGRRYLTTLFIGR